MTFSVDVDFWNALAGPMQDVANRVGTHTGRGKDFASSFSADRSRNLQPDAHPDGETSVSLFWGDSEVTSQSLLTFSSTTDLPDGSVVAADASAATPPISALAESPVLAEAFSPTPVPAQISPEAVIETNAPQPTTPENDLEPPAAGIAAAMPAQLAVAEQEITAQTEESAGPDETHLSAGDPASQGKEQANALLLAAQQIPAASQTAKTPTEATANQADLLAVSLKPSGGEPSSKAQQVLQETRADARFAPQLPDGQAPADTLPGKIEPAVADYAQLLPDDMQATDSVTGATQATSTASTVPAVPPFQVAGGPTAPTQPVASTQLAPTHSVVVATTTQLPDIVARATTDPQDDRIVVQLDPPELGRVSIDFKFDAQGLQHVTITAENPEAMRQLRQMHFELVQALERNGLSGQNLSFQNQTPQQNESWSQQAKAGGNRPDGPSLSGSGLVVAADSNPHRLVASSGRLDIRL